MRMRLIGIVYLFFFVQVNAGPLAYAKAFLKEPGVKEHPPKLVTKLKQVYM